MQPAFLTSAKSATMLIRKNRWPLFMPNPKKTLPAPRRKSAGPLLSAPTNRKSVPKSSNIFAKKNKRSAGKNGAFFCYACFGLSPSAPSAWLIINIILISICLGFIAAQLFIYISLSFSPGQLLIICLTPHLILMYSGA